MAWTAPMTAVANSVFTAAQFNTHVRDNLNETAPAKATTGSSYFVSTGVNSIAERELQFDFVSSNETTTSTSFTDLATSGPSISAVTGARAIVFFSSRLWNETAGQRTTMSFEISGATVVGASDQRALVFDSSTADQRVDATKVVHIGGLTPGTNVFTCKYKVSAGTGHFFERRLDVMPL